MVRDYNKLSQCMLIVQIPPPLKLGHTLFNQASLTSLKGYEVWILKRVPTVSISFVLRKSLDSIRLSLAQV